ncbi:MAG: hypothetical protein ACPG6V_01350 [Flavobacteriales bacterium]
MKTFYSTIIFIIVSVFCLNTEASERDRKGKYTRDKVLKNQYEVNSKFSLEVDNTFGEIKVETWDKNEVSYRIEVISNGDDLSEVQDRLDEISIELLESKNRLSLETRLGNQGSKNRTFTGFVKDLFSGNMKNKTSHIEINYLIYVPKQTNLNLQNDYGYIYLGEIKGNTKINSAYGGLIAHALLSNSNDIYLDYASKSEITHLRRGNVNINYSTLLLHHVGALKLQADYCTTKIDSANTIDFSVDYGSLGLGKVKYVTGSCDYVQVKVEEVVSEFKLNMAYGGLKINRIQSNFDIVDVQSDYATVKLGVENKEAFKINIDTDYASLKGINTYHTIEKSEGRYIGYNKSYETSNEIRVSADYGSVYLFSAE